MVNGKYQSHLEQTSQKIEGRARARRPELQKPRDGIDPELRETRVRLHVPLLKELMQQNGAGGSDWCDLFASGRPMSGGLGEPGA